VLDAWGIKGWIKIQPFGEDPQALLSAARWFVQPPQEGGLKRPPPALTSYPTRLTVAQAREHGGVVVAQIQGVADRTGAEALRGARLFVARAAFPKPRANEYYWVDLIGLSVVNRQGQALGGVVGTLMTNMAVEVALKQAGLDFVRAKVGDRYVLEELQRNSWVLGGEGSGHLLALDKHTTGDGLISALQVLAALVGSGESLADRLAEVTLFPQTMINVRLHPAQDWKANPRLPELQAQVQAELGQTGRVLIRASGTEPLVRVMVEAQCAEAAHRHATALADVVRAS
jgi:16S rRNA processing protein RimM